MALATPPTKQIVVTAWYQDEYGNDSREAYTIPIYKIVPGEINFFPESGFTHIRLRTWPWTVLVYETPEEILERINKLKDNDKHGVD